MQNSSIHATKAFEAISSTRFNLITKHLFYMYMYLNFNLTRKIAPLLFFIFSFSVNAQQTLGELDTYTDPSTADLRLAQSAVSSCEILQEVTKIEANSLSSQEFFDKLQKTDSNGNLLIDTEGCTENILQFVSSLCSSDSNTNKSFCNTLGFSNISNTIGGDYKSYGSSALRGLELGNSNAQALSNNPTLTNEGSSTFSVTSGVSAAGLLFSFTPIKKLKLARNLVRSNVVASRVKPVLSGAMLILATLGLSSCGDVTEPDPDPIIETPCTRGEPGYFQLTSSTGNSASNCIQLIEPPTITYLDEDGNVINTNEITNHSIKVTFKEAVGFIDATDHGNLTPENVVKMVDIKLGDTTSGVSTDLIDVGFSFTVEISSDETSFTLTPEVNYPAGDYVVGVSNYAKKPDISKIANATNRAEYLSRVNSMSQSLSSFSVHTPCSRGEDGYFELRNTNGLTDCIKLILPTISYLDEEGNLTEDTSTITNHSIKVIFDGRVSYIDSSRYEGLTAAFARNMIELNINSENLLTGTFRFQIEAGVEEDEKSFFILTPMSSYPAGSYSVKVKNYVSSPDASKIANATNTEDYLALINKGYSSFSTPNISTLCEENASGYFELTNEDGSKDCIRIPQVVFTFTPRGGREMIESNFDPTSVIKIYFDSEVVYLPDSGQWREITKEDILEMVEISIRPEHGRRVDHVSMDGAIGLDLVSVSNTEGKTVITIDSPYDHTNEEGRIYGFHVPYNIIVTNFAKKADVSKVASSSSIDSYLEDTTTFYQGIHSGLYTATSCDLEYKPSGASYASYHDQHGDEEESEDFICETDEMMHTFLPPSGSTTFDMAMFDAVDDIDMTHLEKTNPGTRHVIDLAFITSDVLFENASGDWRTYFENKVIKGLNKMFQYSGVNVEFRVSLINPFSEYRQYLYCDLPAIENLVHKEHGWKGEGVVVDELTPIIRKQHPVDIFVVMLPSGGGYARIGDGLRHFPVSARWSSSLVMGVSEHLFNMSLNDEQIEASTINARNLLAHEIGHVLRLNHDVDTMIEAGASAESLRTTIYWTNVTTFAYGYGGRNSDEPIGTVMSYARLDQIIPLFSADKQILRSELCDTVERIGESQQYGYCRSSSPNPDRLIKIGGSYKYGMFIDASEAMQYTVGVVSEYSDVGAAPLDLSTVSNAITARALRGH